MANIVVMEFTAKPDITGALPWPPSVTTRIASPDSVTLTAQTQTIIITADADSTVVWGAGPAVASDVPILSAIQNQFNVASGPARVLTFQ